MATDERGGSYDKRRWEIGNSSEILTKIFILLVSVCVVTNGKLSHMKKEIVQNIQR